MTCQRLANFPVSKTKYCRYCRFNISQFFLFHGSIFSSYWHVSGWQAFLFHGPSCSSTAMSAFRSLFWFTNRTTAVNEMSAVHNFSWFMDWAAVVAAVSAFIIFLTHGSSYSGYCRVSFHNFSWLMDRATYCFVSFHNFSWFMDRATIVTDMSAVRNLSLFTNLHNYCHVPNSQPLLFQEWIIILTTLCSWYSVFTLLSVNETSSYSLSSGKRH